jgi:hypothetical protein
MSWRGPLDVSRPHPTSQPWGLNRDDVLDERDDLAAA